MTYTPYRFKGLIVAFALAVQHAALCHPPNFILILFSSGSPLAELQTSGAQPSAPVLTRLLNRSVTFTTAFAPSYRTDENLLAVVTGRLQCVATESSAGSSRPQPLSRYLEQAGYTTGWLGCGRVSETFDLSFLNEYLPARRFRSVDEVLNHVTGRRPFLLLSSAWSLTEQTAGHCRLLIV